MHPKYITGSLKRESCKVLIKGFNKEFLPGSLAEHPIHHLVHSDILHRMLGIHAVLRRISCHGRKHLQAGCEYSLTICLCCQHHSDYWLLGSKFSTNLLFTANKCQVTIKTMWQFEMFKMAEPDGIVAVVKHCWLLVQGRRGCREKSPNTTTG